MNKLLVSLALLFAVVASSTALKCYVCTYSEEFGIGKDCQGPGLNPNYIKDCEATENVACLTSVTTGKQGGVHLNSIARSCSVKSFEPGCTSPGCLKVCNYYCDTDGCNDGNGVENVKFSMLALLTTSAIGLLLFKL